MKKSIIVITLALLMIASIFADSTTQSVSGNLVSGSKSVTTEVVLTLTKTPDYAFGITTGAFTAASIDSSDASKTSITHNKKVTFERDTTNVLNLKSISTYYFSYFFYEYDGITLTMSVDGNLKNTKAYAASDASSHEVPYTITVAANGKSDNTQTSGEKELSWTADTTIYSSKGDVAGNRFTVDYEGTDKLGQYRWASLALTFAPVKTDKTLEGIAEGSYLSTITLKVVAK